MDPEISWTQTIGWTLEETETSQFEHSFQISLNEAMQHRSSNSSKNSNPAHRLKLPQTQNLENRLLNTSENAHPQLGPPDTSDANLGTDP